MRAALLILCGCDSVLRLHGSVPADAVDAAFFDTPADAPYACPSFGMQPAFSQIITQHVLQPCDHYTFDVAEDLAFASCAIEGGMSRGVEQGSGSASMLDAVTLVTPPNTDFDLDGKLAPAGDELWTTAVNTTTGAWSLSVYVQSAPKTWSWSYDAFTIGNTSATPIASTPTSPGPNRTVLYVASDTLYELVEQPSGSWRQVRMYSALFDLGLDSIADANLSPDGLRVVLEGSVGPLVSKTFGAFYADRPSTDVAFGRPVLLDGLPSGVVSPFLAADCGHIYFSALGNVWVAKQVGYSSH